VIGAEYTGPKFAVKAETDILKLEGVKASAVVAQKGAKVSSSRSSSSSSSSNLVRDIPSYTTTTNCPYHY